MRASDYCQERFLGLIQELALLSERQYLLHCLLPPYTLS